MLYAACHIPKRIAAGWQRWVYRSPPFAQSRMVLGIDIPRYDRHGTPQRRRCIITGGMLSRNRQRKDAYLQKRYRNMTSDREFRCTTAVLYSICRSSKTIRVFLRRKRVGICQRNVFLGDQPRAKARRDAQLDTDGFCLYT